MGSNYAVIWTDEEPQYSKGAFEQFGKRNWNVVGFRNPRETLSHIGNDKLDRATTILIVDLMMPYRDELFTDDATRDGFLTGLTLLRLIEKKVLAQLAGVFIYSVVADESLRREVSQWIEDTKETTGRVCLVSKSDVLFFEFPGFVEETMKRWESSSPRVDAS